MFELNGNPVSLEDIQKKANEKGYNVDTYINFLKEQGLVEKTSDVATQDAPVTSTSDTASSSETTSSDLPTISDQEETAIKAKSLGFDVVPGAIQEGDTIYGVTLPEAQASPLTADEQFKLKETQLNVDVENFIEQESKARKVLDEFKAQNFDNNIELNNLSSQAEEIIKTVGLDSFEKGLAAKSVYDEYNKIISEQKELLGPLSEEYGGMVDAYNEIAKQGLSLNDRLEEYNTEVAEKNKNKSPEDIQAEQAFREGRKDLYALTKGIPSFLAPYYAGIEAFTASTIGGLVELVDNYGYKPAIAAIKSLDPDKSFEESLQETISEGYNIDTDMFYKFAEEMNSLQSKFYDDEGKEIGATDLLLEGRVLDAAAVISEQAVASAPSFALSVGMPVAGSAILGLSVAGTETKENLEKRASEGLGKVYANGFAKGSAEFITEFIGGKIARGVKKAKGRGVAEEVVRELPKNVYLNVLGKAGLGFLGEGTTEAATEILNTLADAGIYNDEVVLTQALKQTTDAFLIGGLLGGTVSGGGRALNRVQKRQVYEMMAPVEWQLENNKYELQKAQVKNDLDKAPGAAKPYMQEKLDEVTKKQQEAKDKIFKAFDNMSQGELEAYAKEFDSINKKASVASSNKVSKEARTQAEQDINQAYANMEGLIGESINTAFEKQVVMAKESIKKGKDFRKGVKGLLGALKNKGAKIQMNFGSQEEFKAHLREQQLDQEAEVTAVIQGMNEIIADETADQETRQEAIDIKEFYTQFQRNEMNVIKGNAKRYGSATPNADGSFSIFVNDDAEIRDGVFTTDAHELGHAIVYLVSKGNPELAAQLGKELKTEIDARAEDLEGTVFQRRYESYTKEEGQEFEIFSLAVESISDGDLQFNEGLFEKINDGFRRWFKSATGKAYSFDSGKDVFNFLKDYQKSIEKGVVNKGLVNTIVDGASGKLTEGYAKAIAIDPDEREQEERGQTTFSKEASDKVQQVYEQQGEAGLFDILEAFKPITTRIARRFRDVPGYDEQLIIDEIETGKRGIFDLIREYKPESGVPLAAYINKFLPARSIEAGNRILKTEFEADVTEARGVAAEETVEQQPERKLKAKVLADELNIADKVASEVAEANVDKTKLKNFKSVPNAVTNTVGELLGISPAKIKSKANLTKDEVASAQRWFNKNAQLVIDALPQGFDVEGQATGVPRTVLQALYTQKETRAKTKAGLKGQVKRTNIKDSEFLALVDIIDGKPTRNRNTSARIIALADLLGKTITNQELRKTDPSLARIRSGMSDVMFSKSFNVRPEFRIDLSAIKNERRAVNKLLKLHDLDKTFEVKSTKDIEPFIENVVLPLFRLGPKEMFIGPDGGTVFTSSAKNLGLSASSDTQGPVWRAFVARVKEVAQTAEFGKNIPGVKNSEIWELRNKYNTLFGTPAKAKKAIEDGKAKDFNNKVGKIHKELWSRISKSIKDDRNNAVGLATYLTFTANDTGHWHKLGAQFAGYSKKILGKRYEFEHAMPATAAYNYLLDAAITDADNATNDFDASYDLIIDNYKLIALDKAMDDKLRNARTASGLSLQKVMPDNWSPILNNWYERYFNSVVAAQDGGIDPASIEGLDGRTFDKIYNVNVEGNTMFSKPVSNKPVMSEAISNARPVMQYSKESRGMSTFDFDETLIIEGENFIVATKGDDVQRISSGNWPLQGPKFAEEGYSFDFTDFVNVRGGVDGPLLQKMKNQIKKYGTQNVFVLTARPAESATAIHEWLKTKGINIPFENITGLGNSTGDAKAAWFLDKYAEGYNDMYFVDDALPNVEAVQHVFNQLDAKGKSVQAKIQFSKGLSTEFNKMLERTKGVGAEKIFSRIGAQKRGKNVGRFTFFVPPSADDFAGLLRYFVGKGEQGNRDLDFFNKALIKPFARADRDMKEARQSILDDHKTLRKEMPQVVKKLGKMIDDSGFTFDNAIRVYLWDKAGFDIPGLSKRDIAFLTNRVKTDQDLKTYADVIGQISKQKEGYIEPSEYWNVESIAADLQNVVNKQGRKKFLAEWKENVDVIFSPENLNKIEAAYGSNFREALENILWRMENGTNRAKGMGRLEGAWNNWVNNSVGAIMFFNARSAVLQTLSTVNFINFEDNNIFAAAKAFGNQKQYWKDFSFLFNSDFLKQRRAGLQTNINEAEIASAVAGTANKAKAALQYILKQGFLPTQIADSFAIASGGATYYRNRVKKYVKQGLSQTEAETQAMEDFMEIAEETQQSARPDRISQQQASSLGRIILAFANTPMQYARLIKKASVDLVKGRGDWRSNVSRIIYYGAIQNIIFSSLQSAIFALAFDDEEPEQDEIDTKVQRTLNGMIDSLLRGSGLAGAVVSTLKNVINRFIQESEKKSRADYGNVLVDALNVSPPIGSKSRKLYNATKTYKYNREVMGEMNTFDLENPVWDAVGNVVSATTNLPLDRGFRKIDNMKEALNQDNETWQRVAVGLGWDQWSLGIDSRKEVQEARELIKEKKKEEKKKSQQRCTKIKSDGTRCKIMVNKPKTRCHYHD